MILCNEGLRVDDENSLFDSILEVVTRDSSYSSLFKYIRFEFLDPEHLSLFFEVVYPEYLDSFLWNSITSFISDSVSNGSSVKKLKEKKLNYDSSIRVP